VPSLGGANAVKVEATGDRAHNLDGVSEPYNGGTRHARCADANLLKNTKVVRYLNANHAEIYSEFETIVAAETV
jgi:hypothetical protein